MFANTYVGKQDDSKAAAAAASIACSTHHEYDSIFPRKHLVFNRHESIIPNSYSGSRAAPIISGFQCVFSSFFLLNRR